MTETAFASLKRGKKSLYEQVLAESAKLNQNNNTDDRYWAPTVDKAGNGIAVIRFLPPPAGETLPWARVFSHWFQGPGGWYVENSLTTNGQDDPCSEYNSVLWNRGDDAGKDQARKQKRKLTFTSNIYVISDPANKDNEGKVFLYKYGKKIFDKINDAMLPEFAGEVAINPFDLWEGANFKMKIREVEGYRNYDSSTFDAVSSLLGGNDKKLEAIWESQHSLADLVSDKNFKTYAELKAKLNRALKGAVGGNTGDVSPRTTAAPVSAQTPPPVMSTANVPATLGEDDDSLDFFRQLAANPEDEIPF